MAPFVTRNQVNRAACGSSVVTTLAWAVLLLACAGVGFLELFSSFRPYDDEGLMMLSNQLFLTGYKPYVEITWIYGPVYLAWVQLVHGLAGVPLSHEATRFVTLLLWLSVSGVSGWLAFSLTASRLWALASALLSFVFTKSVVNEPGHPQTLIALAALFIPILAGGGAETRAVWRWILLGGLAAIVSNIKPNAGLFILASIGVALASQVRVSPWRDRLMAVSVLISLGFPFLLMSPLLTEIHCARFAMISGLSAAAVAAVAFASDVQCLNLRRSLVGFLAGFAGITLLALGNSLLLGIWPQDILASLLSYADGQVEFYHFFREYSLGQVVLATISALCASLFFLWRDRPMGHRILYFSRACFVFAGLYSVVIDDPAHAQAMVGWAGPWCWTLVPDNDARIASPARLLLAAIAVWSPLLAYPIPGSQLYFGSLPLLLGAIVCAADMTGMFGTIAAKKLAAGHIPPGLQVLVPGIALALAVLVLHNQLEDAGARYREQELLALPGTGSLRIEPARASHYRELAALASQHDVAFTTFRFNSLFFWSTARIPAPGSLSQFPLDYSSNEGQSKVYSALSRAGSALLIDRVDMQKARESGSSVDWIETEYEPLRRVGPYILLEKRKEDPGRD